jgi:mevalonate kinase
MSAAIDPASEPVPSRPLPISARAPGKCIVFGEHAVVHGKPELLLAIDLGTQVTVRGAERFRLNGDAEPLSGPGYFPRAIDELWPQRSPLEVRTVSRIPRAAGLGSSAAFVAALATALGAATGGLERSSLAQKAFAVERGAQGVGSPGDTSAVVAGGLLTLNAGAGALLWEVRDGERTWTVRRVPDPGWNWLVAYSGIPRNTGLTVQAVGRRLAEADGPALLERFESVALEGLDAVRAEDRARVGACMEENHRLLVEVGVSHPRLEALRAAVAPVVEGSKVTGAGAGGSIVALPRPGRELEAVRRIARAGGVAFPVRVAPKGASLVEPPVDVRAEG